MAGHGVIELSCIFIAGGAGMLFGFSVVMPGDLSRADALRIRGRDAIRLVVGCVPLLIVAGIIEGLSPGLISPPSVRLAGVRCGALHLPYACGARSWVLKQNGLKSARAGASHLADIKRVSFDSHCSCREGRLATARALRKRPLLQHPPLYRI